MLTKELEINERLFNPSLNEFVIFCHNYTTIFLVCRILSLIETFYSNYRIIIVVNSSSLYLYFTKIFKGGSNISIYNIGSPSVTLRKPYRIINEIVTKYRLLVKFKSIVNTNVIFSSKNYVYRDYFIIQVLRRRRSNHFCYIDKFHESVVNRRKVHKLPIIKKLGLFFLKEIYGKDLGYYSLGNVLFAGISDSYLNTFPAVRLQELACIDIDYERPQIRVPYKIIYFDSGLFSLSNEILDLKKFKQLLVELFSRINQTGVNKDDIGIKFKPASKGYLPILEYGNEIENFIPAQCLIAKNCKMIFTVFSTSSNAFGKDVVKISIIDLLPWRDHETYRTYKKLLIEEREECLVPKSIEEFVEIVSKIICKS